MTLFADREIRRAVCAYDLSETENEAQVAFSERFERRMDGLIRTRRRMDKMAFAARGAALLASLAVVIAFGARFIAPMSTPNEATPAVPVVPEGRLALADDEPNLSRGAGGKTDSGAVPHTWDEARQAASFSLREPSELPEDAELLFLELTQRGDNASYPCVAAMYAVPMEVPDAGSWHVYFHQYYLGPIGRVELKPNASAETVRIGDVEGLYYTFKLDEDDEGGFIMLHWIRDGVLYRICAPAQGHMFLNDKPAGFTLEDLLAIATSLK